MRHITALALLVPAIALLAASSTQPDPGWTYLGSDDIQMGDALDSSGDLNGDGYDDLVIGAPKANGNKGRILVFLGSENGLAAQPTWTYDSVNAGDHLGASICTSGDINHDGVNDILAGASGGANNPGFVYIFYGTQAAPWVPTMSPTIPSGPSNNSGFGSSVAAGDANGDGNDDILVGAPSLYKTGSTGAVYLFNGPLPLFVLPSWTYSGKSQVFGIGSSVAFVGNMDGDTASGNPVEDFVVGAPLGIASVGTALAFKGGSPPTLVWETKGEGTTGFDSYYGGCVVGLDVDHDGYGDVVVGSPDIAGQLGPKYGRVYLYLGSPSGLPTEPSQKIDGLYPQSQFGDRMARLKDVNNDGRDDLIMGTLDGANGAGEVFILKSRTSTPGFETTIESYPGSFDDTGFGMLFGASVGGGDVNGDGIGDYVVGMPWLNEGTGTKPGGAVAYYSFNPKQLVPSNVAQSTLDGMTPLAEGGSTHEPGFLAKASLKVPSTIGAASLQVDAVPVGTAFTDPPATTFTGPAIAASGTGTAAVTGLVPGTKLHWRARLVSGSFTSDWISFGVGNESAADVQVVVNPPPSTAAVSVVLGPGALPVKAGDTVFDQDLLTVQGTATDPDQNAVRLEVEFRPATGKSGKVIAVQGDLVASGSIAKAAMPLLPPGQVFTVRSRVVDEFGVTSAWTEGFGGAGASASIKVASFGSMAEPPSCSASGRTSAWMSLLLVALLRRRNC